MKVIYESEDNLVISEQNGSDRVAITFSFFPKPDGPPHAFAQRAVKSAGFNGIFVIAKTPHWCQTEDRDSLIEAVNDAAFPYRTRIAYGISKGGYSALSPGAAMGCSRIVAISPQTVISDPSVPLRQDWQSAISSRPILHDDIPADLGHVVPEIVYDPINARDSSHVRYLRERHPVREGRFPFASHKILVTLKQCGLLQLATSTWLSDAADSPALRIAFRQERHRSLQYFMILGIEHWRRGRIDVVLRCADRIGAMGHEHERARLLQLVSQTAGGASSVLTSEVALG